MKNIIVLSDFSAEAAHAAECALAFAPKLGADIFLVNTYAFTPNVPLSAIASASSHMPEKRQLSTRRLNGEVRRLEKHLKGLKLTGHTPVIRPIALEGQLCECVSLLAWRKKTQLVVMGVSERSYGDLLFDGDVKAVLKSVKCPVLVVPLGWGGRDIRHILFGTDLAAADETLLEKLLTISDRLQAVVSLCHVSAPVVIPDFAEETRVSAFTGKIARLHPGVSWYVKRENNVIEALDKLSTEKHADVIALRYRRHSVWYRMFNENPLKEAIEHCKIPLLIFPEDSQYDD